MNEIWDATRNNLEAVSSEVLLWRQAVAAMALAKLGTPQPVGQHLEMADLQWVTPLSYSTQPLARLVQRPDLPPGTPVEVLLPSGVVVASVVVHSEAQQVYCRGCKGPFPRNRIRKSRGHQRWTQYGYWEPVLDMDVGVWYDWAVPDSGVVGQCCLDQHGWRQAPPPDAVILSWLD